MVLEQPDDQSEDSNTDAVTGVYADPTTSAVATVYEAESAALSGGAVLATDHSGYSGSAFVGGFTDGNKGNAAVQFTVSASAAGSHDAALRYANGTGSAQTLSVYVNGVKVKQISLAATASWDTWGTRTDALTLNAGTNTIRYKFDTTDSGNVNIDNLSLTAPVTPPPAGSGPLFEAESAALSGGAVLATDHTGYTGVGFVGGFTDGNKGNAAVQFTVNASAAGSFDAALRYANGTGSAQTLSIYVNGTKLSQISLPATASWDTWGTRTDALTLNAGTNTIRYKFDTTDSGNVNIDSVNVSAAAPPPPPPPPPPAGSIVYEAEDNFFSGGVTRDGSSTYLQNFVNIGARVIFTVNMDAAAASSVALRYANGSGASKTLNVLVNGLYVATTTLAATGGATTWADKTESLNLRRGLNTISYQYDDQNTGGVNIDSIAVANGKPLVSRGATLPYQELEAEAGTTNATVLAPNRTFLTVEAESSGRRAVKLTAAGHFVQWTAPQAANSLVVRYSMPDSTAGNGTTGSLSLYVNGTKTQTLSLSSKYAWVYGGYPYFTDPALGSPHHFYDESRFLLQTPIPAGATVKLQRESGDSTPFYTVDLIDLEQVDAPYAMPQNFVSIASFGAVADDAGDDTQAIQSAISNAKSTGKAGVFIPPGVFRMTQRVTLDNVQVRGAGAWYSLLQGANGVGGFIGGGNKIKVIDLAFSNDSIVRRDGEERAVLEGAFGTGSLIQGVWIEHAKVGIWLNAGVTDGLFAVSGRIRDTWADGVNMDGGIKNTTVSQFNNRNTGDDAFALWSEGNANDNCTYRYNTAQLPALANTFGVYGGKDNKVFDNVGVDTVHASAGIAVNNRFGAVPFSGTTELRRNTMTRTGGFDDVYSTNVGGLWIATDSQAITAGILVDGLNLNDSTFEGIKLSMKDTNSQVISPLTVSNVNITGAGTFGLSFAGPTGTGTFSNVTVTGAGSGGLNNPGNKYTIIRGPGNVGW